MEAQEYDQHMEKMLITYCPCPDLDCAEMLAKQLLNQHLAGCVQILPAVRSLYRWEGTLHDESEHPLLIKSTTSNAAAILSYLETSHPYDCPCIVQQELTHCNDGYLAWMLQQCAKEA